MQTEELSYAIITPYSMRKSRTGGIIARLISRTGLDLVAARMFAPGEELVRRYAETIVSETEPAHRATQELIHEYVLKNFGAKKDRQQSRVLFLVFRGPDAAARMRATVGHITHEETSGETIRDTFGDYVTDDSGKVIYFEPAVVAEFNRNAIERDLKLWAEFSDRDGGVLDQAVQFPKDAKIEKTLVLIKPDNFKFPNIRPGGVIEVFSRWEDIVEFMAGTRPSDTLPEKRDAPGTEKCIALVYQGEDAVRKIREVLGPTDPAKAPPGSIRKEFGQTIMINAAHASDSIENAKREMAIVRVEENNFKPLIENFYGRQ
jgi:nucleoside diphosphate kinase